jgi:predicted ferric reductase
MKPSTAFETADVTPGSVLLSTLVGAALAAGGFGIGLGATGLAEGSTSFWYLSRASGFVAYVLLWGSVVWGLLLSTGIGREWMRPPVLLDAHQFLSTAALGFAAFHGLILMGDRYVSFPLRAIVLPFAGSYEPLLVACGQIAAWLSLLLIVSFRVRHRIGGRMWRRLHYASFIAFWLALAHGLLLGSESTTSWASFIYLLTAGTVTFLSLHRVLSLPILHGPLVGGDAARQT